MFVTKFRELSRRQPACARILVVFNIALTLPIYHRPAIHYSLKLRKVFLGFFTAALDEFHDGEKKAALAAFVSTASHCPDADLGPHGKSCCCAPSSVRATSRAKTR